MRTDTNCAAELCGRSALVRAVLLMSGRLLDAAGFLPGWRAGAKDYGVISYVSSLGRLLNAVGPLTVLAVRRPLQIQKMSTPGRLRRPEGWIFQLCLILFGSIFGQHVYPNAMQGAPDNSDHERRRNAGGYCWIEGLPEFFSRFEDIAQKA